MIDYCDFLEDRQPECGPSGIINYQSSIINQESCRVSIQAAGYLTRIPVAAACGTPGGFFLPLRVFLRTSDTRWAATDVRAFAVPA